MAKKATKKKTGAPKVKVSDLRALKGGSVKGGVKRNTKA
jgi:hypothetical protein